MINPAVNTQPGSEVPKGCRTPRFEAFRALLEGALASRKELCDAAKRAHVSATVSAQVEILDIANDPERKFYLVTTHDSLTKCVISAKIFNHSPTYEEIAEMMAGESSNYNYFKKMEERVKRRNLRRRKLGQQP